MKYVLAIFAIVISVLIGTRLNCGNDKPTKPETILVHDTLRLKADTVYASVNHYIIRNAQGEEIHDTTLLLRIDTVLKSEGVKEFTACADTVVIDTFHVCYRYTAKRFDMIIDFAPRTKDTVIAFETKRNPFVVSAPFVVARIDLNQKIFSGIGYEALFLGRFQISGEVGLEIAPVRTNANLSGRYQF